MLSRRRFLSIGPVAAAASVVPGLASSEQAPGQAALPPSIAALTPMRDKVRAITGEERLARVEKARRLMADNGLAAMMLTGGTSLVYFSNIRWGLSERLFAMILPVKGEPFFVCPGFESRRASEQIALSPFVAPGKGPDVRVWQEDESPYALVAQGLKDRGVVTGRIGIEETVRFVFSDGVAKASMPTIAPPIPPPTRVSISWALSSTRTS
jgi:Xaa-Pro dipeptidase